MLTQCPECQTVFRLSLGQLEAADGRVRCGLCNSVFNALSAAGEQLDPAFETPEIEASPIALTQAAESGPSPDSLEDTAEHELLEIEIESTPSIEITMEGERIDIDGEELIEEVVEDTGELIAIDAPSAQQEQQPEQGQEQEQEPEPEELPIDLETPLQRPAHSEDTQRIHASTGSLEPSSRGQIPAEVQPASLPRSHEIVLPSGRRVTFGEALQPEESLPSMLMPKLRPHMRAWWIGGSAAVALVLLSQLVHFNREVLARSALLGPLVVRVYGLLGLELSPAWNLHAYELRQWGATADPGAGGALRVRASLFNNGDRAQPYPLLRLALQDRFGGTVATRDLTPREYLPGARPGKLLAAGQRVDAEISVVDPGKDAVGFEMDVCLRAGPQRVVCANDPRR